MCRGAEVAGLKRKLHNKLSPQAAALRTDWGVGECVGTFWRPNFDSHLYAPVSAELLASRSCSLHPSQSFACSMFWNLADPLQLLTQLLCYTGFLTFLHMSPNQRR